MMKLDFNHATPSLLQISSFSQTDFCINRSVVLVLYHLKHWSTAQKGHRGAENKWLHFGAAHQTLRVSPSSAIPNWNYLICEERGGGGKEKACMGEEILSPPWGSPFFYPWYSWRTWDRVSQRGDGATVSLWVFHSAVFVGTREQPTQGLVWRLHQPWRTSTLRFLLLLLSGVRVCSRLS